MRDGAIFQISEHGGGYHNGSMNTVQGAGKFDLVADKNIFLLDTMNGVRVNIFK